MKLTTVLLRWYKSFNTSYTTTYGADRQAGKPRPWNKWTLPNGKTEDFPFIEIPIDQDITIVVGANESGKSHLLNAISKVVTGDGIPGDPFSKGSETKPYSQTDLCHFSSLLDKNLEVWPHIGVQFSDLSTDDISNIKSATGLSTDPSTILTLILTNEAADVSARLYSNDLLTKIDATTLDKLRKHLPQVMFINSQLAIADEVPLTDLLAAYGKQTRSSPHFFPVKVAQEAAELISNTNFKANTQIDAELAKTVATLRERLTQRSAIPAQLELMLFRDVLGISSEALEKLFALEDGDRGHAESLIARWNEEIERKLNLSRYWQQDQEFSLSINYKRGVLYFEITDKTGCVYTFRERSSGLRYFLSYYIQAKSLETRLNNRDSVILMDEPDSFLSILGQRNLLSIFESLVSDRLSSGQIQLLYTTHSPFLINRNFPNRIRLVRKGDSEEGTQYVEQSRIRRFEPVRSALGIDLAQTLFMGGTNILLEGPVDQYLICELIRIFSGCEGMNDLLDLNSVILVSSESAPGVEQVLSASQWTDEPIPTVIVILDNDEAGHNVRDRITGKSRHAKQLVSPEFVCLISEIVSPYGENKVISTTEDLIPVEVYKMAVLKYLDRWIELDASTRSAIENRFSGFDFSSTGLANATLTILKEFEITRGKSYDKMGIAHEVIAIIRSGNFSAGSKAQVGNCLLQLSRFLKERIENSDQAERIRSGKHAISRIIGDFFTKNKESSTPYELEILFGRLQREADSFGDDADDLRRSLTSSIGDLKKLRDQGPALISGDDWRQWYDRLVRIRKNPLQPDVMIDPEGDVQNSTGMSAITPENSRTTVGSPAITDETLA